jgi:phage terminase large subunit-like protein
MTNDATKAIKFLESLEIPQGPKAGRRLKLAPFQRKFVRGAMKKSTAVACLSIARGNGKSALSSGLALGSLLGEWDRQPRREILVAARTRDQAKIIMDFAAGFTQSLPEDVQEQLIFRRSPRLEIEYEGDGGGHVLRAIAADPKNALGSAPTLCLMDERGHWPEEKGDDLESALLSGLGKRGGRAIIISTSASNDQHSFSQWLDNPPPNTYTQEHRPAPGQPADDLDSILEANPGARYGVGSAPAWLQAQAQRAIARGGNALASYRLFNRNERVSGESRDVLVSVDTWLDCEVSELPPREGGAVVGIDLGGSSSMTAMAAFWPNTGRLEAFGAFPRNPSLEDRGRADAVGRRYVEMADRNELVTMGDRVVPTGEFIAEVMRRLDGAPVLTFVSDRFRESEFREALAAAGVRAPVHFRGQGFRDGSEDCERFRQATFDGLVSVKPSLLLRSALSEAVTVQDDAGNKKIAKSRSAGRIDAAAATVLAIAEGERRRRNPAQQARSPVWA